MKLSTLTYWKKNPRSISDENLEKLKSSLQKDPWFLEKRPILVNHIDGEYVVYAWNMRLKWLLALWYDEVKENWVSIDKDLSEEIMEERAIKDNTEYGSRSNDLLVENFTKEQIESMDLPVDEIDLEIFDVEPDVDEEIQDSIPQPKKEAKVVELWDIFQLWDHRIMCWDSTDPTNVSKLLDWKLFDMVLTDPPYNTGMSGWSEKARLSQMFNDSFTDEERDTFLHDFLSNYYLNMKENSVAYICLDWRRNHELIKVVKDTGFHLSNIIVWDKVVHWLGSDYKYTYELINVCKKGNPILDTHQWDREYSDVWHIQRKMGKDEDHATKKPIELCERPINHGSSKGDIIWDLFLWSGSTIIASEKLSRKCYGMELDPIYIEVILKRFHNYTKWAKDIKCINRDIDLSVVLQDNKQ